MPFLPLSFTLLTPGVATGEPAPAGWCKLADLPLLIIVGVTGVGKSTTLAKLAKSALRYTLLPNRRELTDQLIIPAVQAHDGQPVTPVNDRKLRFGYTARYRQLHPGGMSHALTQLWIDPAQSAGLWLFDGLRGADEVGHALHLLPNARFIVLHAPDGVRVQRLLVRKDDFDRVESDAAQPAHATLRNFEELGIAEARTIFTAQEEETLLKLVQAGEASADDLRAKVQIVLEERRNYDPYAALHLLQTEAPERTLVIDTTQHWPDQVILKILERLGDWSLDCLSAIQSPNHPIS